MKSRLQNLRAKLADLRRRRQTVRWATGYSALALAVLWSLAAVFVFDWGLEPTRLQRALVLAAGAGVVIWAFRRFTRPHLGHRESELDMALLVERQQNIDSDLVAALQFESPEAPRWGSVQLQRAVVDYVADYGRGWNVLEGLSHKQLVERGGALLATLVLGAILALAAPGHLAAFFNRLLLGSAHYPTQTQLERVYVNGREVDLSPGHASEIPCVYGRPLQFRVSAAGALPAQGRVELRSAGGLRTTLELAPQNPTPGRRAYAAQLAKTVDPLSFQLYLGDAWTDPAEVRLIALPAVELRLTARTPRYARARERGQPAPSSRQVSVLEGSAVELELTSDKPLRRADLSIQQQRFSLVPAEAGDGARRWRLRTEGTPLAEVTRPLRFELTVTDRDGLQLEAPLQGSIRLKPDQRPRVAAEVVTRHVLPTARPEISYRASDDFGLARLVVRQQAVKNDGSTIDLPPVTIVELRGAEARDRLAGSYALALAPHGLEKGDQLKVQVEAVDDRGTRPGQAAASEPIVFQVTDESGVLAAISESDERSARRLDDIIKRQLGIGDSK